MTLRIDTAGSRVVIETRAKGMLASLAHDLRVLAPIAGELVSEDRCVATCTVGSMRVDESSKHGADRWGPPAPGDRAQIEEKIAAEVFRGVSTIQVEATLAGTRATITVSAGAARQQVSLPVQLERTEAAARVRGECMISLEALKATQPKVPLGAIKLEDAVKVRFDVRFTG